MLKNNSYIHPAAIVAAANGIPMARHGARAITSRCGTVDIMEALGVDVDCSAETVAHSIRTVGIGLFNLKTAVKLSKML